jgi:hypothetical protein
MRLQRAGARVALDPPHHAGSLPIVPVPDERDRRLLALVGGEPGVHEPEQLLDHIRVPEPAFGKHARVVVAQEQRADPGVELGQQAPRHSGVGRRDDPRRHRPRLRSGGEVADLGGERAGEAGEVVDATGQRVDRPPQGLHLARQPGDGGRAVRPDARHPRRQAVRRGRALEDARADALAFTAFGEVAADLEPQSSERLNHKIRRGTDVVGISPDRDALIRLVGAVLLEEHDEWAQGPRHLGLDVLTRARLTTAVAGTADSSGGEVTTTSTTVAALSTRPGRKIRRQPSSATSAGLDGITTRRGEGRAR